MTEEILSGLGRLLVVGGVIREGEGMTQPLVESSVEPRGAKPRQTAPRRAKESQGEPKYPGERAESSKSSPLGIYALSPVLRTLIPPRWTYIIRPS